MKTLRTRGINSQRGGAYNKACVTSGEMLDAGFRDPYRGVNLGICKEGRTLWSFGALGLRISKHSDFSNRLKKNSSKLF